MFGFTRNKPHFPSRHTKPQSSVTTSSVVAVMAVSLSLATYMYNSLLRLHGNNADPIVQTSLGLVQGNLQTSREGRVYFEFLGIPYAEPPIDDLRFERPVEAKPWKGIRSTKSYGSTCMQLEIMVTGRTQGEESCLFLNIFSPRLGNGLDGSGTLKAVQLLPVLVFLHGGLFMSGSSNMYRGKYFMDKDVVLVTLNYRLSALGFLNTGNLIKGNMGLFDQNMALKWIKANIARFGGDPQKITLFGESAGGASVHFHMLSPASEGLFSKAISQSGTALQIWALSRSPKTQARQLAGAVGCPIQNELEMVKCLKKVDARKLVKYHISSMSPIRQNTDIFGPTIDGEFLPGEPLELLKNGSFAKIPWLTGVNAGEGLLNTGRILASRNIVDNLWANWNKWIPIMLDYDPKRFDISGLIRDRYFPTVPLSRNKGIFSSTNPSSIIANLTQIYSDRVYFLDSRKAALFHAQHAPVYLYYYSYPGEISFFRLFKAVMPTQSDFVAPELKIAVDVGLDIVRKYLLRQGQTYPDVPCHADELLLLFNTHRLVEVGKNSRDFLVSKELVNSWTQFATSNWTLSYQNKDWPPVIQPVAINSTIVSNTLPYMQINLNGRVIPEPFTDAVHFWTRLGF